MSTPDYEIHRAIVHSSDTATGAAEVRIPSLLGAGQVVNVPTTGLTVTAGEWNVPSAGSSAFVAVSVDRTQFLWVTGVTVPTDGATDFTGNVTIGGDLGIGTTTPSTALHVAGSILSDDSVTIGSGGEYVAGSIYSDANWGMILRGKQASPAQAEFRLANSSDTELMRIDSEGNLTTPTSSWFHARLSATVSSWNSNDQTLVVPYNSVVRNIGNDYSGSGGSVGLYTAPVAGRYCFTASLYTTSGTTPLSQYWFVINGSRAETPSIGGSANIRGGTGVIYLNAGDSVGVHFWAGGIGNINLQVSSLHTFFMGGLIT